MTQQFKKIARKLENLVLFIRILDGTMVRIEKGNLLEDLVLLIAMLSLVTTPFW